MTMEDAAVTFVKLDPTFSNAFPGGIYAYGKTTRKGFNRISFPDTFDQETGIINRTCIIKERQETLFPGIQSETEQIQTYAQVIEFWMYADGDEGYTNLAAARDRLYFVMQNQQMPGTFQALWITNVNNLRDRDLKDACLVRSDYRIIAMRSL